ncbi:MAG: phosphatase PAP2 family protein [Myxococcota bacterium]|nr:phosphatase PAP2 family protein [Myxococcota bacterium]
MSLLRRLGPDGTLAFAAIIALALVAHSLGGALRMPWDGIVPFLAIGSVMIVSSTAVDVVVRRPLGLSRALRLWAPFAVVYLCYRALRGALPALVDSGVESALVRADVLLLGSSPAWSLEAIHAPWLTELLAYAYATMFFLPLAVLLVLHARRRDRELRHVALSLQLAFYLGFTIFLLVPARSPDVIYDFAPLVGHGFYERSMAAWRSLQAVTYDAFPSMHTAISTLALVHAYRLRLRLWMVMLPIVVLLQFATLYLRQHYFVDVVAGWTVAAIAIAGAAQLERLWAYSGRATSFERSSSPSNT